MDADHPRNLESFARCFTIYCFSESDFSGLSSVRIVELDVANLWRLQAQRGLFLDFRDQEQVPDIRSIATRIFFPSVKLTEQERSYLYPVRKSALENVLDQWFYRHQVDTMMSDFVGIKHHLTVKRYSYPGAFQWRVVPDLPPTWVGEHQGWFLPIVEPEAVLRSTSPVSISLPASSDIGDAVEHVRCLVEAPILASRTSGQLLTFAIDVDSTTYPLVAGAERLLNRVWDGVRTLPYDLSELVACISLTTALVLLRATGHDEIDDWHENLWGETDLLEVAPVGGHIEAGFVSKAALAEAFTTSHFHELASPFRRLAEANRRDLMTFVVDPWILFDFKRFKRIFVEQFIPSAVDGYWKEDIGLYEGALQCMWSIPFNPALLGYVTNKDYRFRSPLAHEANVEQIIYVTPTMDEADIEEAFVHSLPHVLDTGQPFQVRFPGYELDPRQVWEIDKTIQQCKAIVATSGISVLEVTTASRGPSQPRQPFDVPGLGAFEIWLIANDLLDKVVGRPMADLQPLLEKFMSELAVANGDLEARLNARLSSQSQSDKDAGTAA